MEGWDVITTPLNDVRRIGGFSNLKQHWDADEHLRLKDLRHMYDILCARHPDYKVDADAVLNGRTAAFCNMFIMRKDIFFEYNEWLFPLLNEFAAATDFSKMDVQTTRTVGHLSGTAAQHLHCAQAAHRRALEGQATAVRAFPASGTGHRSQAA